MDYKIYQFLSMMVFVMPQLVLCTAGLVFGLMRRDLGRRATLGSWGFGALALSFAFAVAQIYLSVYVGAKENFEQFVRMATAIGIMTLLLQLGGFALLLVAAFPREKKLTAETPESAKPGGAS